MTVPRDRISLRGVRAFGHHGVLPESLTLGQRTLEDVFLELYRRPADAG